MFQTSDPKKTGLAKSPIGILFIFLILLIILHRILIISFFWGFGVLGCPADENAAGETSEDVAEAESALNYTFTVPKNPTSLKSNKLKITVTPGSGGVIKWFTVADNSPFFEHYTGEVNSTKAVITYTPLPCASYGTSKVNVEYTGPFPKLNYYWTDCK